MTPLKKLASIFLLLALAFNFCGYRLLIAYVQTDATDCLEKKLDRQDYNDAELISVKTTLHLPYYNSSKDFERAYGSININGVDYEYVKRRVYNDTLELLCLPNTTKTQLQKFSNEISKSTADGQASTPVKKNTTYKIQLPDFFQQTGEAITNLVSLSTQNFRAAYNSRCAAGHHSRQERPPQPMQS